MDIITLEHMQETSIRKVDYLTNVFVDMTSTFKFAT